MIEEITSKSNSLLTHIRKLQNDRAYRYEHRQFVGEGTKLLAEAPTPEVVVLCGYGSYDGPGRIVRVSEQLMKGISTLTTPQAALFVHKMPEITQPTGLACSLVLDGIQDPGNLGTMIRTANALGIQRIILCGGCADPYNPKVVRATMGAIFRQPIYQMSHEELLDMAAAQGTPLIATALSDKAVDVRGVDLKNTAVIIGSEGSGVSARLLEGADKCVIIPISESCESMNAAVAASIIMWEMTK